MIGRDAGGDRTSSGDASGGLPPRSGELPLVHRLAVAYLLAPVAVWLLGWFHWWAGVPATALLVVGAWQALSGSWRWRRPSRTMLVLALVAAAWVATAMAVHVADFFTHRAILLDLTRGGWPTYPVDYLSDSPPLLRYYLGWYMVPALLGRWLGPAALNWAVPLWTWCGAVLVVLLFARGLPTLRAALAAVAVLVLFSGMDVVEMALREGVPDAVRMLLDRLDPEWVPPSGQDRRINFVRTAASPMLLEHEFPTRWLMFGPQHFLPAYLGTLLMLGLRERRRFLVASGVVLACCLFWSPLVSTGLLPLAAAMLVKNPNARYAASWQNIFVAVPLAALIALYMTSGHIDFERGWLWELYDDRIQLAADVLLLYAAEFMVLATLLWRLDPRLARDPTFVTAIAMLLVVPWYWYGSPRLDEWGIKFERPALMMLAYYAARAVVARPPGKLARTRPAYRALLAVLAVGAVTTVWEIGLQMHGRPRFSPYETLGHSLLTHQPPTVVRQRTAYSVGPPLDDLLRDRDRDEGEDKKGALLIRSAYDVYLRDNQLVYVKKRCRRGDGQARTRFYVDFHPADPRALSAGSADAGHERRVFRLVPWRHYKEGGGCVIPVRLPDYDIARIATGQTGPDGDAVWEGEAHLTPNPPAGRGR